MTSYFPLILGMALATYLPRVLPLMTLSNKNLSNKTRVFLQFIPYTSLSILIVRGILTSDIKLPALAGILTAGLLSYWKGNAILSVFGGILVSYLILSWI
ncbi:MAG: AzlD domain-containing protein [Tissierellia bacterium]|nr:AzlD domain-containing protein [Tissierellia bacterium]